VTPATEPRTRRESTRMLVLRPGEATFRDTLVSHLPDLLEPGDLLVVNDAATLPASLFAKSSTNAPIEIRLLQYVGGSDWKAVLLGAGDWRTPTEMREAPEEVAPGSVLRIAQDFTAEVIEVSTAVDRIVILRFSRRGADMWTAIYDHGRAIQYAYMNTELALWSVQTVYASRPWAAEMPSAGRPLTWRILMELRKRGIAVTAVTHSAGVSSIGDCNLDAHLPLSERFEVPQATVDAVRNTHRAGGRVIAVGTTVVRALEGCSAKNAGHLVAGGGETDLVIGATFSPTIVDGILTGVHDPTQSHFQLLRAFADENLLLGAWRHAEQQGYRCHEFGDLYLILPFDLSA